MYLTLVLRVIFVALAFAVGFWLHRASPEVFRLYFPFLMAGFAMGIIGVELVFQRRHLKTLVAAIAGLMLGVIVTAVVVGLFLLFTTEPSLEVRVRSISHFIPVIALFICYFAISIVLQTKDQFRFVIPYVDFSDQGPPSGGIVLDTSVLVDGRMVELASSGLVGATLIVPAFVLKELHQLADSANAEKRSRGRRGLDMVALLRTRAACPVRVEEMDVSEAPDVDSKLIRVTQTLGARLATTDLNLAKLARVQRAPVINLNEVAFAMRPSVVPGDELLLQIVRPGEKPGQGVGYLEDGTMVVVENARSRMQEKIKVVATGVNQTSAGRLIFARPLGEGGSEES